MSAFNILPESQQKSSIFCKIVFTILVAVKGSTGFGQTNRSPCCKYCDTWIMTLVSPQNLLVISGIKKAFLKGFF